jgi:hypothetical protein
MANSLKVHPAFVLIAAIIVANLIGILGVIVAAPLLATLQLVGRYTFRKLVDRDPWPLEEDIIPPRRIPKWVRKIRSWWQKRFRKGPKLEKTTAQNLSDTKNAK